jgi:hypothetical protein
MFFSLTLIGGRGRISTLCEGCISPPSSSGLGRSPLKAETGVRFPLGALIGPEPNQDDLVRFLAMLRFDQREELNRLPFDFDKSRSL